MFKVGKKVIYSNNNKTRYMHRRKKEERREKRKEKSNEKGWQWGNSNESESYLRTPSVH